MAVHLAVKEVLHLVPTTGDFYALAADAGAICVLVIHRSNGHRPVAAQGELVAIRAGNHRQAAGLGPWVHLRGNDHDRRAQMARAIPHRPVLELGGLLLHLSAHGRHLVGVINKLIEGGQARQALHRVALHHADGAGHVPQVRLRDHGFLLGRRVRALRRRRQVIHVARRAALRLTGHRHGRRRPQGGACDHRRRLLTRLLGLLRRRLGLLGQL
mmetsp:Transcript_17669/g.50865  ORF Transcript_17669/g.50865 Transcript_17669/m.50865 type:complete len:214 (-) Transcript_17669:382-1023(-)